MTNGEKFVDVFGFGADGSRIIAVNSTWWDCDFQIRKPKTNADRIRAMSNKELATRITCPRTMPCIHLEDGYPCVNCKLDWLREEAE